MKHFYPIFLLIFFFPILITAKNQEIHPNYKIDDYNSYLIDYLSDSQNFSEVLISYNPALKNMAIIVKSVETGQIQHVAKIESNRPHEFFLMDLNDDSFKEINYFEQKGKSKWFSSFDLTTESFVMKDYLFSSDSKNAQSETIEKQYAPILIKRRNLPAYLLFSGEHALRLLDISSPKITRIPFSGKLTQMLQFSSNKVLLISQKADSLILKKLNFHDDNIDSVRKIVPLFGENSTISAQSWIISGRPYLLLSELNHQNKKMYLSLYDMNIRFIKKDSIPFQNKNIVPLKSIQSEQFFIAFFSKKNIVIRHFEGLLDEKPSFSGTITADSISSFYFLHNSCIIFGKNKNDNVLTVINTETNSIQSIKLPPILLTNPSILYMSGHDIIINEKNSIYRFPLVTYQNKNKILPFFLSLLIGVSVCLLTYLGYFYFKAQQPIKMALPILLTESNTIKLLTAPMAGIWFNVSGSTIRPGRKWFPLPSKDSSGTNNEIAELTNRLNDLNHEYQFTSRILPNSNSFLLYGLHRSEMNLYHIRDFLSFLFSQNEPINNIRTIPWTSENISYSLHLANGILHADWNKLETVSPAAIVKKIALSVFSSKDSLMPDMAVDLSQNELTLNEQVFILIVQELLNNAFYHSTSGKPSISLQLMEDPASSFSSFLEISISNPIESISLSEEDMVQAFVSSVPDRTGLGLTFISFIINKLSGQMHLNIVPGSGFTIVVGIPVTIEKE